MLSEIRTELLAFLRGQAGLDAAFGAETDLLANGVLDSLLLIDLVLHVERVFGVTLGSGDVTPTNFRSVESLACLVCQHADLPRRRVA
ncbi:MAG: acyl carrier protein [Pirellulaceae bacterium]|jgi:acyl carrier protein|nr:acyl carrier protein [Pirellulaceae bacterium]